MSTKSWEPCGRGGHVYGSGCADCRDAARQQAAPTGDGDVVMDAVLQRMAEIANAPGNLYLTPDQFEAVRSALEQRAEFGQKKYGTKLRILNGRDATFDLYQELLDAIMYAMQARMEGKPGGYMVELLIGLAGQIVGRFDI